METILIIVAMYASYLLFIKVKKNVSLTVGSLGVIRFKRGIYIYVGSGGKNVFKRINRHFRKEKKLRWHIDYLTTRFKPYMAWIIKGWNVDEDMLASILLDRYEHIDGFGATDSRHPSHLFYIASNDDVSMLRDLLESMGYDILEISNRDG